MDHGCAVSDALGAVLGPHVALAALAGPLADRDCTLAECYTLLQDGGRPALLARLKRAGLSNIVERQALVKAIATAKRDPRPYALARLPRLLPPPLPAVPPGALDFSASKSQVSAPRPAQTLAPRQPAPDPHPSRRSATSRTCARCSSSAGGGAASTSRSASMTRCTRTIACSWSASTAGEAWRWTLSCSTSTPGTARCTLGWRWPRRAARAPPFPCTRHTQG